MSKVVKFDWLEDDIEPATDSEGNPIIGILCDEDVIYKEGKFYWKGFSSKDIGFIIQCSKNKEKG